MKQFALPGTVWVALFLAINEMAQGLDFGPEAPWVITALLVVMSLIAKGIEETQRDDAEADDASKDPATIGQPRGVTLAERRSLLSRILLG